MLVLQQQAGFGADFMGLDAAGRAMSVGRGMTPRKLKDMCCEPYHPCCDELITHNGLGADPTIIESVADRVQRLRAQMISIGIPAAVGSGAFTTLVFAGAFGLAHTERVWAPALLLGGVATLAGLVSVALASKAIDTNTAATKTAQPTATATVVAPNPAAFGRYY